MYSGGNNIEGRVLATALGCSQTRRSWSCYGFHVSYMHLHSFLQLAWFASFLKGTSFTKKRIRWISRFRWGLLGNLKPSMSCVAGYKKRMWCEALIPGKVSKSELLAAVLKSSFGLREERKGEIGSGTHQVPTRRVSRGFFHTKGWVGVSCHAVGWWHLRS